MLRIKRKYKQKPFRFLSPDLGHPQLKDLLEGWYFIERAGRPRGVVRKELATFLGSGWHKGRIRHSAITDRVHLIDNSFAFGFPTNNCTVVISLEKTDVDNRDSGAFCIQDSSWDAACSALLPFQDGTVYWDFGGFSEGSTRLSVSGLNTQGRHIWAFTTGPRGMEIWQDGILRASNAGNPTRLASGGAFRLNQYIDRTNRGDLADVDFIHVFDNQISVEQIKSIAWDPWAPFESSLYVQPAEAVPGVITGTGALQAQSASVSGQGDRISVGAGALQAQDASVSGAGEVIGVTTGTGALQAQDAAVTGVGEVRTPAVGTGTLQAQSSQVSGAGAIVHDGAGTLQAQSAAVVGVGEVGNVRTGAGALQAQPAAVSGQGDRTSVGTGTLQAQAAAVSGAGVVEGLISGTGALQAQNAAVAGAGIVARVGAGALQAQSAQVAGIGAILGDLSLTPADIAAIADAVYAKLVSEGLVNQISEIWQRRGLDSANPQTYDKAGNQIRVGDITIDLSGDPSSVTQTRQP